MGLCVAPQSTHLGCLPYGINYVSNRGQISTGAIGQVADNRCDQQVTGT